MFFLYLFDLDSTVDLCCLSISINLKLNLLSIGLILYYSTIGPIVVCMLCLRSKLNSLNFLNFYSLFFLRSKSYSEMLPSNLPVWGCSLNTYFIVCLFLRLLVFVFSWMLTDSDLRYLLFCLAFFKNCPMKWSKNVLSRLILSLSLLFLAISIIAFMNCEKLILFS